MKYFLLLVLTMFFSCKNAVVNKNKKTEKEVSVKTSTTELYKKKESELKIKEGFLFVDIKKIYFYGGKIALLNDKKDTLIYFKDTKAVFKNEEYDIIEDEVSYNDNIKVKSFDPEYGLFILKCFGLKDGFYEIQINDKKGYINKEDHRNFLKFKGIEKFILDSYPVPNKENPIRLNPNETAEIIKNFDNFSYISVEIKGDWLKVKDDKECYPGEEPSKKDIIGWVRWRKEGKIILKFAHSC
ncbi:hypothetical protein [Tenacibaculum halocynthiae]|uniref:hypothetical protein n=1 Tax=Tenacibaculum halocynthiae TaxID=1254437 RepID=UPI003D653CF2